MTHPIGERDLVEQTASKKPMALDSFGGRVHARWSPDEAVTPLGQLPFFGNYMRKCASEGQSLANAERGVGMSGFADKIGD